MRTQPPDPTPSLELVDLLTKRPSWLPFDVPWINELAARTICLSMTPSQSEIEYAIEQTRIRRAHLRNPSGYLLTVLKTIHVDEHAQRTVQRWAQQRRDRAALAEDLQRQREQHARGWNNAQPAPSTQTTRSDAQHPPPKPTDAQPLTREERIALIKQAFAATPTPPSSAPLD